MLGLGYTLIYTTYPHSMNFLDYPISNKYRSKTPKGFYDSVKGHTGIDVVCPVKTEISLPFPVQVLNFKRQNEMGDTLYLKDFYGNILVFSHLSKVLTPINKGRLIVKDEVFALSGNTGGKTTAPHVHFEVIAKNPEKGLEFMTRKLADYTGYNIDPTIYLQSLDVRFQKIKAWKTWPTAKRVARAALERLRTILNSK